MRFVAFSRAIVTIPPALAKLYPVVLGTLHVALQNLRTSTRLILAGLTKKMGRINLRGACLAVPSERVRRTRRVRRTPKQGSTNPVLIYFSNMEMKFRMDAKI